MCSRQIHRRRESSLGVPSVRVILEADVYGSSIPAMLGLSGKPESPDIKSIKPMRVFGEGAMSIDFALGVSD